MLEDVCKNQGFDPEEHCLKYVFGKLFANVINQPFYFAKVGQSWILVSNLGLIEYTSIEDEAIFNSFK